LAVIILAILSNDSISRSRSSSRSGSSSSSSSSSGSSSDSRNPSGDSPRATTDDPDSSKNPIVKVTEANYDPDAERLRLKAEARSRSNAEIALTGFVMLSFAGDGFRAPNLQNSREVSSGRQHILETSLEIPEDKIDAGVVQYRAKTKDTEGRTGTQEDSFPLKAGVPDGSSGTGSGTPINIDVDYGGSDSEDSSSDDGSGGDRSDPAGSETQIKILNISPNKAKEGINTDKISVELLAQADSEENLDSIGIELVWPIGSKFSNSIDVSGKVVSDKKTMSAWLDQKMSLSARGTYVLKTSVTDTARNTDSDYYKININADSTSTSMASIEDLHEQQDREIEQFHQGIKEIKELHENHKEDIELETELLDEAKDILQKLNDLEDVEEAIRNHLITDLDDTRNLGPRQLKSKSETELEQMASDAELTTALNEAIASTDFHNSSGSINTARDLGKYVSNLVMEFEDLQDTLNKERQHQARDNSLIQKLEGQVEEGLSLEKKNANLVQEFLQNAASSDSAR
jgi:hypothetical protein